MKTVLLGKDLRQHGHAFLRSVFFVSGDQNDCLAFARAFCQQIKNLMMSLENGKDRR